MLKSVWNFTDDSGAAVTMAEAQFPAPFHSGLEYGAPARGCWNIVHTGMLLPEAHQIFVCAAGCLRGVVLTAAEMGAAHRFSTVEIRENNVLDGDMEELIIDGVSDILARLPKLPPAVLLYTSCIHHFMGCDLLRVYRVLREKFPGVDFTDCYMNPIMRKSGTTPDELMRRQLYSLLEERPKDPKAVNIIGNDLPFAQGSDHLRLIAQSGWKLRDVTACKSYAAYKEMAEASLNIYNIPAARFAAIQLERRLGQPYLYLPQCFGYDEMDRNQAALANALGIPAEDSANLRAAADSALAKAKELIGDAPVAIDYTFSFRPLSLARLLLEKGFRVTEVYADSFIAEEKDDFDWLKTHHPELKVCATLHAKRRVLARERGEKTLALGQKAAYFTGSDYFVNMVEGGGLYGYDGIMKLAALMAEAWLAPKDARKLIQIKGMGSEGCCI